MRRTRCFFKNPTNVILTNVNRDRNLSLGDYSCEGTPGNMPNPEVKLARADGTWGAAPWESRSLPRDFSFNLKYRSSIRYAKSRSLPRDFSFNYIVRLGVLAKAFMFNPPDLASVIPAFHPFSLVSHRADLMPKNYSSPAVRHRGHHYPRSSRCPTVLVFILFPQ